MPEALILPLMKTQQNGYLTRVVAVPAVVDQEGEAAADPMGFRVIEREGQDWSMLQDLGSRHIGLIMQGPSSQKI